MNGVSGNMGKWVCGWTICFVMAAGPLAAQTPADSARPAEPFFTKRDIYRAAGFVAAVGIASRFDKKLADWSQTSGLQDSQTLQHVGNFFNFMGQPAPQIIGVGLFATGKIIHSNRTQRLGLHGFEAMLMSNVITTTIKGLAGRERPIKGIELGGQHDPDNFKFFRGFTGGSGYQSFPSGHATTAFAAASAVTSEITEWQHESNWSPTVPLVVGITMYGGATMVGWARMYKDKHWASDVMAGAMIGTFSGIKVVRYSYRHPHNWADKTLLSANVVPMTDGRTAVAWNISF